MSVLLKLSGSPSGLPSMKYVMKLCSKVVLYEWELQCVCWNCWVADGIPVDCEATDCKQGERDVSAWAHCLCFWHGKLLCPPPCTLLCNSFIEYCPSLVLAPCFVVYFITVLLSLGTVNSGETTTEIHLWMLMTMTYAGWRVCTWHTHHCSPKQGRLSSPSGYGLSCKPYVVVACDHLPVAFLPLSSRFYCEDAVLKVQQP